MSGEPGDDGVSGGMIVVENRRFEFQFFFRLIFFKILRPNFSSFFVFFSSSPTVFDCLDGFVFFPLVGR